MLSSRAMTPSRVQLYLTEAEQKDKAFLSNLRSAIELKNEEFEKVNHEKSKLVSVKSELEKEVAELTRQLTTKNAE